MDYILIISIILIPVIANIYVQVTYKKYRQIVLKNDLSGCEVANKILANNQLDKLYVVEVPGTMTDHYDSSRQAVRLSHDVFRNNTIASIAIAAHECGHAIQDKEQNFLMRIRTIIFPVVSFANSIAGWVIVLGFILNILDLVYLGIACVTIGLMFQLITLPLEFNASKKALAEVEKNFDLISDELNGIKKVLNAAALTYVAGVLATMLQLLRLFLNANDRK